MTVALIGFVDDGHGPPRPDNYVLNTEKAELSPLRHPERSEGPAEMRSDEGRNSGLV
jgi:hypothetical protein